MGIDNLVRLDDDVWRKVIKILDRDREFYEKFGIYKGEIFYPFRCGKGRSFIMSSSLEEMKNSIKGSGLMKFEGIDHLISYNFNSTLLVTLSIYDNLNNKDLLEKADESDRIMRIEYVKNKVKEVLIPLGYQERKVENNIISIAEKAKENSVEDITKTNTNTDDAA